MQHADLAADQLPQINVELDVLTSLADLDHLNILEIGCGSARLARQLLVRYPACRVTGIEVDAVQHEKNLSHPQTGLQFLQASAAQLPFDADSFDMAMMLKSLHHVPLNSMDRALNEVARVLRPGGLFYVSEPIYAGALNHIVRLYNDEGVVREAAQAAINRALTHTHIWEQVAEQRFSQAVHFADFAAFETRMLYPSFADHHIDATLLDQIRHAFMPHCGADGAHFVRPMHVRLLRLKGPPR